MKDFARNFFGLIFLAGADCIVGGIFIALIIANYLACKSSFDYLGYDGLPLAKEAFIGQIVGPFLPETTLSHFYAFVVAVVIAIGLFVLYNRLFHIWELLKERKGYLSQNDKDSAQIILYHIYDDIGLIIAILPFLIAAIIWDIELFKYRSVYGALGIEDPAQAPLAVENWDNQIKNHGHLYAWTLTPVGAFGYIGITGVSCAVLEFCFRRTTERFMRLIGNMESIFQPSVQQEEQALYGYDAAMQPVYDPAVPVFYDVSGNPVEFYGYDADGYPVYDLQTTLAYDTEGNPIQESTSTEPEHADGNGAAASSQEYQQQEEAETQKETPDASRQTNSEASQDQSAAGMHRTQREGAQSSRPGAASGCSGNSRGPLFNDEEVFQNVGGRRNENTQLKDVIGKPGETAGLVEAMADKVRYWVDPDTLEIWDRDYRRILFPGTC